VLPSTPHFLWVTEFPLFSCRDEDKEFLTRGRRWSSTHHPFTAPMYEDLPALYAGDYGRVRGQHYDIVLNGVEIGGGSVRIHDPEMQEYVFQNVLQVSAHHNCFSILHASLLGLPALVCERASSFSEHAPDGFYYIGPSGQCILMPAADVLFAHPSFFPCDSRPSLTRRSLWLV